MEDSTQSPKQSSAPLVGEEVVDSVTLARLIEEVRNEGANVKRDYDRTHNRHNR